MRSGNGNLFDDDFDPLAGLLGLSEAVKLEPLLTPEEEAAMAWFKELEANTPPDFWGPAHPGLGAARRVRFPDPRFAAAPSLPFPFDGSTETARLAVRQLAFPPDGTEENDKDREASAAWLLLAYEGRHGLVLELGDALRLWWKAAREQVDIAAACGFPAGLDMPHRSPNAFFASLRRAAAFDFASAKRIPIASLRDAMARVGVALPPEDRPKRKRR